MSRAPQGRENVNTSYTEGYQKDPTTQASQGASDFVDGSGPIFSMYLDMATEEDKKMVEGWKADADGILIFTGLFSAAVTVLISISIQDIRPNPLETTNFYLANIYQNQFNISNSLPASPPTFSAPNHAVWVNKLWFLSLVISMTCALLATLLQQWARRYLEVTQPRYSLHKRARIRAFFFEGVEKALLPWVVDTLPTLLHVSLFLFFAGLAVFMHNVDLAVFKSVLGWIGVCAALYGYFTFVPIIHRDIPYSTPLSSPLWHIIAGILYIVFWITLILSLPLWHWLSLETIHRFLNLGYRCHKMLMQSRLKTVEQTALDSPSEIISRALMWTFDSLDEDHELECFFSGLPGFRNSRLVPDPLPHLDLVQRGRLLDAAVGLCDRTFLSDLLPASVKNRRAITCARALGALSFYERIMEYVLYEDKCKGLQTTEFGHTVSSWGGRGDEATAIMIEAVVINIVAKVHQRDDSWFSLASKALAVPESVLRDYAKHGDSLSLAILVHFTRRHFSLLRKKIWPTDTFGDVLEDISKFNVRDTLPELQHEFCTLWNQIVLKAQNDNDWGMAYNALRPIRNIYITLHQDTDSAPTQFSSSTRDYHIILRDPSSYPMCNVPGHIHDNSAPTTFSHAVLPDGAVPVTASIPNAPFSSVPAPFHIAESLTDVRRSDNEKSAPGPTFSAHQSTIENLSVPITSLDPFTHVIQGHSETSTVPLSTTESSTPASHPVSSISTLSPGDIAIQNVTHHNTPSAVPASASPTQVIIADVPPKDSRSTVLDSASPDPPHPRLRSPPDLGTASTGEDDGVKAGVLETNGPVESPTNPAIHANTMETLELRQTPSVSFVTESGPGNGGPSLRKSVTGRTEVHFPQLWHGRDDIV